jgi:hypothetical protein
LNLVIQVVTAYDISKLYRCETEERAVQVLDAYLKLASRYQQAWESPLVELGYHCEEVYKLMAQADKLPTVSTSTSSSSAADTYAAGYFGLQHKKCSIDQQNRIGVVIGCSHWDNKEGKVIRVKYSRQLHSDMHAVVLHHPTTLIPTHQIPVKILLEKGVMIEGKDVIPAISMSWREGDGHWVHKHTIPLWTANAVQDAAQYFQRYKIQELMK